MKKFIALIIGLALALQAFALVGCKKGKKVVYDPENFLTQAEAETLYGNPYRIVKDKVTLKIFVPKGTMNPPYSSMKMFRKLSELTNLEFDFTEADTAAYSTLRSTAWREDLPDMFLFGNTKNEQVRYSQYGSIIPFNDPDLEVEGIKVGDLIENYMPVYKKLLDDNFGLTTAVSAKQAVTLADGKMYSTVSANDVPRDLTYKMWINEQWIRNINQTPSLSARLKSEFGVESLPLADDIKTIEEYLLVLRAFKKLDANLNGKADDEVPASALEMQYLRNFILESYGAATNGIEISNDGTTFLYTPATEAYKKYLETAATMYSEGLIDTSTFTYKTDSQMAAKGYEGRLGSFAAAAAYLIVGYNYDNDYTVFGPFTSGYYTGKPIHYGFSNFKATAAEIPAGTPYVRELARLIDIMYSDIGVQLIAYGEEGVDWTWDDDARTSWTFHVPEGWKKTQEEYRATITPNVGTGACLYWSYDFVGKMNDDIIRKLNTQSERYMPYIKVDVPEDIVLTSDEYDRANLMANSLFNCVKSEEYEFVTGKKKVNKDWDNYLNKLEGYRYKEYLKIYNDALARKNAK
ncbi:MAG: hypothetical protein IJR61_02415 [Clostridia bacterium]|nr:hypothetical protein [Clostridia bacterium]